MKNLFKITTYPIIFFIFFYSMSSCSNNPYSKNEIAENTLLSSFNTRLKYVDPVKSYYSYEAVIIDQIYETLFQYHYLKRPFELIPSLASLVPKPKEKWVTLENGKQLRVRSYRIQIKSEITYADNPCFAYNEELGRHSRYVTSDDFIYAFKRIADPKLACPIFPVLLDRIVGMKEFYEYNKAQESTDYTYVLPGIHRVDHLTFEIWLNEPYPQILYWLAMHFTAPMPVEAIHFYREKAFEHLSEKEKKVTMYYLDWPVGTGPFKLGTWRKGEKIVLTRNEHFRDEYYPREGEKGDEKKGLLEDKGKKLPLLDKIIFSFENESIPKWNKFTQGYYDASGIGKDHFDRVITESSTLSESMIERGIKLDVSVASDIYYYGFNMKDEVVGGYSDKQRWLRQAIAKAFDVKKYLRIFRNGRGIVPTGPVPPGIFGYDEIVSPGGSYDLGQAKVLLAKAGYANGIDPKTGKKLVIRYDNPSTGSSERPGLVFFKNQIEALGIDVEIASTDLNTFRKKILTGNYQIFSSGWLLDYPDPENFLFLLYSLNGTVDHHGDNRANYDNKEFDQLFKKMETMPNTMDRRNIIHQMVRIVNRDKPWIYLLHSVDYILYYKWLKNIKIHDLVNNKLKYYRVDNKTRIEYIEKQNHPVYWPVVLFFILLLSAMIPGVILIKKKYS